MNVLAASLATLLALAPPNPSMPELFQKMKEQVKAEKWTDALVTIEVIDVEAAKPANASLKPQLEAPLAFYRGVCESNAGNAAKGEASFETYLRAQPNASIDEKMYSKKAVSAFEAARKAIASEGPSIARAYAEFQPPAAASDPVTAAWGDGPVKWLMTDGEKRPGPRPRRMPTAPPSSRSSGRCATSRTIPRFSRRSKSASPSPTPTSSRARRGEA